MTSAGILSVDIGLASMGRVLLKFNGFIIAPAGLTIGRVQMDLLPLSLTELSVIEGFQGPTGEGSALAFIYSKASFVSLATRYLGISLKRGIKVYSSSSPLASRFRRLIDSRLAVGSR